MVSSPSPLVACILIVVILAVTVCLSELSELYYRRGIVGFKDIFLGFPGRLALTPARTLPLISVPYRPRAASRAAACLLTR